MTSAAMDMAYHYQLMLARSIQSKTSHLTQSRVTPTQPWASLPDKYTSSTKVESSQVEYSVGKIFKKSSQVKSRLGVLRAVKFIE